MSDTVVVADPWRLRIATTPTEELNWAKTEAWPSETVMLAVELEREDG